MKRNYFVPINGIQWLTLGLLIATIGGFVYGVNQLHDASAAIAKTQAQILYEQSHQNDALHSIICQAEHAVRVRPGIPHDQRVQAERFYQKAARRAHLKPCP